MRQQGIQYRIRKGVVVARLGDVSIFALQQAINNAEVTQANAESAGDAAGAAAANALANSLHSQMAAIYATATPPDKVAQVNYVLTATAPTAPVVTAAPTTPPTAPAAARPALANELRVSGPVAAAPTTAAPAAPAFNVPVWAWFLAGGAALYFAVK